MDMRGIVMTRKMSGMPGRGLEELFAEAERFGPENRPAFEDWGILPSEWPGDDWSDIAPTNQEMACGAWTNPGAVAADVSGN